MTFHIFQSEKDQLYYFHLKASNGEIVLRSQGYQSEQGAQKGIAAVKRRGKDEGNYEMKGSKSKKHFFTLKSGNGRIIATSQLYEQAASCEKTIRSIAQSL